ncbi:MAG: BspA family leucine-rich repeat surface protein [Bacteroides sp.]
MKKTYGFITTIVVALLGFSCIGNTLAQGLPFITKWECKKGKEVPIPIVGTYKMLITDASGQEKVNETVTVADANHPYIFKPTEDGIYTVTAGPEGVECIQTKNRNYIELIEVVQFGTVEWTSMEKAFQRCLRMTFAENIDIPNLSKVTSMMNMFFECNAFNSSLKGWDVSHVTNMCAMFYNCYSFNQSLEGWDVSKVTDMRQMFYNCTSFNQSLTGWDVSNVTKMGQMFFGCTSFNQSLTGWDVRNVTDMRRIFYGAPPLTSRSMRGK